MRRRLSSRYPVPAHPGALAALDSEQRRARLAERLCARLLTCKVALGTPAPRCSDSEPTHHGVWG